MSDDKPYKVMFSAGETSGEQHAAHMFQEMQALQPGILGFGMGGAKMMAAGIDVRYDSSRIAVIGVVEVLKHYAEIRRALNLMKALLAEEKPDLLVCVDYKEFNFKLATHAKSLGVKVLFYVSPQVWAWRPGRVKQYGRVIDMMAVIFPFETAYYEAENVPVRYVGHPSVDKVKPRYGKDEAFERFGLQTGRQVVGLLPGSRGGEINSMLPVMLQAAEVLARRMPSVQFILPQAASISDAEFQGHLGASGVKVTRVKQHAYDVMQCCDAIMTTSGTATLEIALLGVPMVVCYKLSPLTYWLGRLLVKTPFIGLPNIVAGEGIVKELIQHDASAENLAAEVERILTDADYASQMRANLQTVKAKLGPGGGSRNMAELALEMLNGK